MADQSLSLTRPCLTVCQEEQVNTIAGRYYPDGPVFVCQDGFPHFTDQVQWNMSIIQNTAVICSNLQTDIELQDDEGNIAHCYLMVCD